MISQHQNSNSTSRAIVAVPLRDEHTARLAVKLRACLEAFDLGVVVEGEWTCYDDWKEQGQDEGVKCWWAIFKRGRLELFDALRTSTHRDDILT